MGQFTFVTTGSSYQKLQPKYRYGFHKKLQVPKDLFGVYFMKNIGTGINYILNAATNLPNT
jgi:hypothetical protein